MILFIEIFILHSKQTLIRTLMENINKQRKQLEEKLIAKAMKDETFRKNLLENPKAAIEDETGIKLPESISLKVVEENLSTFYLILPPKINPETEDELSEAELEMVSGGYDGFPPESELASCTLSSCWL
jgi:hypothetical protein